MATTTVQISNLQALNVGDGKTISVSWSVPDINQIKYFIVEYWDRNKYQWIPYDGFHGLVSAKPGVDSSPPQKINFATSFTNCQLSFRARAVATNLTMSNWSNGSVEVRAFIADTTGGSGSVSIGDGSIKGGTTADTGWSLNADGSVFLNSLFPSSSSSQMVSLMGSFSISKNLIIGGTISWGEQYQRTETAVDLDAPMLSGFYSSVISTGSNHQPNNDTNHWLFLNIKNTSSSNLSNYQMQFAGSFHDSNNLFYRATLGTSNTPWHRVWHDGNAPFSYSGTNFTFGSPTLSGGNSVIDLILPNLSNFTFKNGSTIIFETGVNTVLSSDLVFNTTSSSERHITGAVSGIGNWGFFVNSTNCGLWDWQNSRSIWNYTASSNTLATSAASVTVTGTLTASKLYNAVYMDYAEYFLKEEELEAGDIVCKNINGKGYIKSPSAYNKLVVGVLSDQYAQCIGGDKNVTLEQQETKYAPIGLAGRLKVKVTGVVKPGDLLVSSAIHGVAMSASKYVPGTVIGKALGNHTGNSIEKIEMLILNM